LISTAVEPAGSHCTAGGIRIDVGVDSNESHVLDPPEITATSYVCNGSDAADGGMARCPATCDDGNSCTTDICGSSTNFLCVNVPAVDGASCDDGDACTVDDTCRGGRCSPGAPRRCEPLGVCKTSTCNRTTGACEESNQPDGSSCEAGPPVCRNMGKCVGGICTGVQCTCDICTADNCVPDTDGCQIFPVGSSDFELCETVYACFTNRRATAPTRAIR